MRFRKRLEVTGSCMLVTATMASMPAMAASEEQLQEQEQLLFEIRQLKLINESQSRQIQLMEQRLTGLEQQNAESGQQQQQQQQASASDDEIKREAGPSQSVEDVLQQEHALFSNKWTLEGGITYSHYDRKQLVLDGFLALDAIFLGDISVDDVESDIFTFDLGADYTVNDRWQMGINVPLISRFSTYTKSAPTYENTVQADVDATMKLGDIELNSFYKLFDETQGSWPDTVWNLRLKMPTGKDPYGIKTRTEERGDPDNPTVLTYPGELATGSGLWALGTGLSFVKTVDPAILFASIDYTHQFANDFSDISSDPDVTTPGEVRLGDSLGFGFGVAFAINDRMSLSLAYSQRLQEESESKASGGPWVTAIGSDANAATFTTGITYALDPSLSMSTSLGIGLTPDSPDFTVGIKFPYRF